MLSIIKINYGAGKAAQSVSKVLALKAQGAEFDPQCLCKESQMWWHALINPAKGRWRQNDNLAPSMISSPGYSLSQERGRPHQRNYTKDWIVLLSPYASTYTWLGMHTIR